MRAVLLRHVQRAPIMSRYDAGDVCRMYEVEPGDTFYSIAQDFSCPLQAIHDANPSLDVERLQVSVRRALGRVRNRSRVSRSFARRLIPTRCVVEASPGATNTLLTSEGDGGGSRGCHSDFFFSFIFFPYSRAFHAVVVSRS